MKKIITYFCIAFTVICLFCSFYATVSKGTNSVHDVGYRVDEVEVSGNKYIVVYGNTGVAICKK